MISPEQEKIIDDFLLLVDENNVLSECTRVSLICNRTLGKMFLFPEEIEEIELSVKKRFLSNKVFRKLWLFCKDYWNEIRQLDLNLDNKGIQNKALYILWNKTISEIIEIFSETDYAIIEQSLDTFILYFLAIEKWYKDQTWDQLSFKWLEHEVGYDDYFGF